jgi:glutathione S-transferase
LTVAGVDFEDDRLPPKSWPELKGSTPFGCLPVLEIEGRGRLAETNAILTFIGRGHDLHPKDSWQAAQHLSVMSAAEHLRHASAATSKASSEEEKKAAREALAAGTLSRFGKSVEAMIGEGPFLAGQEINVADIKLYVVLRGYVTGIFDYISKDVFSEYTKLMKLYEAVEKHPKVAGWMNR